jgi:CP family cyanate transporter-like MFS transporter
VGRDIACVNLEAWRHPAGATAAGHRGGLSRTHYDRDVTESPARPSTQATRSAPGAVAAKPAATALLTAGVLLFAANMRPVAASVGPLVPQLRDALGLSGASAGLLLTIPVLCFGVVAPLAPLLAHRLGMVRTLVLILVAIVGGLIVRVTGSVVALFCGTTLAAAGAACGNVLLPVVVARDFSHRVGRISALYTTALAGMAALAAGVTVPLANAIGRGWQGGLAVWALPTLVALAVWLPLLARNAAAPAAHAPRAHLRDVTGSPLAWQLTIFFGLQSWSFYVTLAWLPSIFESHGLSSTAAGLLLGLCSAMAVPGALLAPQVAARWRDQRRLVAALSAVAALGFAGLLAAPASAPVLWSLLIGIGQGALFPLALTMIVLRSGAGHLTASLSTHVQSIGYLLAASGPLVIGLVHDTTGSWTAPVAVLLLLLAPQTLAGLGAARDRVLDRPAPATSAC